MKAKESGLIDDLLRKFYPKIFSSVDGLDLLSRTELDLSVPEEILPREKK